MEIRKPTQHESYSGDVQQPATGYFRIDRVCLRRVDHPTAVYR